MSAARPISPASPRSVFAARTQGGQRQTPHYPEGQIAKEQEVDERDQEPIGQPGVSLRAESRSPARVPHAP